MKNKEYREKKNSEYWEKRIANSTWKQYNSLEERNKKLLEFYIDASESVKDELYKLAEKYSKDGVLSRTEIHKRNRLQKLNQNFEKIIEDLGHKVETFAKENMQQGFENVNENISKEMGEIDFAMPNKNLMEKLFEEEWRGDSFSGRLWKNQRKLARGLNSILLIGLQQGKTATEMAVQLHNFMGKGFNECHRLVRTETMHYLNSATLQRYKDANVEYVQIWAAADERTCTTCGGYHTKIYPLEKAPILPLHANCRCTYLPVMDKEVIAEYREENDYIELNDTTDKWAEEAKKELLKSEQTICERDYETMEIYDSKGKFLSSKRGKVDSVSISLLDYFKLKNAVVTHNHPSAGSFSFTDLKFLKRMPISELRVSTINGSYYIRKPKEWPEEIKSSEKMKEVYEQIKKDLRKKYQKMYNEGKITKVERHIMFKDEVNKTFAERYGIDYGFELYEENIEE